MAAERRKASGAPESAQPGRDAAGAAELPPPDDSPDAVERSAEFAIEAGAVEPEERAEWILPWEVALFVSKRRSGKSTLMLALAGAFSRCQILFLDVKCRYVVPGVVPTVGLDALADLDWSKQRVIHFQPAAVATMDDRQAEQREWWGVFAIANERVDLTTVCDESVPEPFGVNATPATGRRYVERKAVDRCGLLAASGRWRGTSTHLRAHANHIVIWPGGLADDELDDVAREVGISRQELRDLLEQARELGPYACLWCDRDQALFRLVPPLPEQLRELVLAHEIVPDASAPDDAGARDPGAEDELREPASPDDDEEPEEA